MKHSSITLGVTIFIFAIAIFSTWFFAINDAPLAGMVLNTLAIVTGGLSALVTSLLYKEGN